MTRTRSLRGKFWGTALVVLVAAGSSLAVTSRPALAAACPIAIAGNCTATQSVTATISAGALSLTAPATLVIPPTVPGVNTGALTLGTLTVQDTLNDSTNMTVVVDPTDLGTGTASCPGTPRTSVATLWPGWNFNTSSTVFAANAAFPGTAGTLTKGSTASPTTSGTDSLANSCTYDGTAGGVTLATATDTGNANEGAWDMTGTTVNLNIAGTAIAGAYTASLQYTITG